MKKVICIYIIRSKSNKNRVYIGSTNDFCNRKRQHIGSLKLNKHANIFLQRHFNKYGIDDFSFDLVEIVQIAHNLEAREQFWIDVCNPYFNINLTAVRIKGKKRSIEFCEAQRKRMLGTSRASGKRTPDVCARISASRMGQPRSAEVIEKWKLKMAGKWYTKKGKRHSPEVIEKIRQSSLGRKRKLE